MAMSLLDPFDARRRSALFCFRLLPDLKPPPFMALTALAPLPTAMGDGGKGFTRTAAVVEDVASLQENKASTTNVFDVCLITHARRHACTHTTQCNAMHAHGTAKRCRCVCMCEPVV